MFDSSLGLYDNIKTAQRTRLKGLHARSLYACALDQAGKTGVHRKMPCDPARFLELLEPFRKDIVVAVECLFCWYWLADLCAEENIPFVLGHALYIT